MSYWQKFKSILGRIPTKKQIKDLMVKGWKYLQWLEEQRIKAMIKSGRGFF